MWPSVGVNILIIFVRIKDGPRTVCNGQVILFCFQCATYGIAQVQRRAHAFCSC